MYRRVICCVCAIAAGLMLACPVSAQTQTSLNRFERQLEQIRRDTRELIDTSIPPEQRALIDYGGYASFYFLALDHPTTNETHILRQTDVNGWLRANFDNAHQFFIRGRVGYQDWNDGDSFDGEGDKWIYPTLDRAVYQFDLRNAMRAYEGQDIDWNFTLSGGRQLVNWGNGLALSEDIDGALLGFEYGPADLQLLAGRSRPDQVDIDSSRPNFDDRMVRDFYGGLMTFHLADGKHNPYIYGLVQHDGNPDNVLTVGPTTTHFDYNSFYVGLGSQGRFTEHLSYGVEIAFEGGNTLSSSFIPAGGGGFTAVPQTRDNIRAWAADAQLNYYFHDPAGSALSAEFLVASGDSDRVLNSSNTFGGNTPGTTDYAFNAFGLINTGYSFSPNVSNLVMLRLGGSTYPFRGTSLFNRFQVGMNFFVYNKLNNNGPIDEPTSDTGFLGVETDFFANWQVTSDLALSARYGVFFPGSAMPNFESARHFFFTGVTVAF